MSPIQLVFRGRVSVGEIDELLNSTGIYATFRKDQMSLCDFAERSRIIIT